MNFLPGWSHSGLLRSTKAAAAWTYIGHFQGQSNNGTVGWPIGTQAGDQAIFMMCNSDNNSYMSGPSQMTGPSPIHSGTQWGTWKIDKLTAAQITTPPTWTSNDANGGILGIVTRSSNPNPLITWKTQQDNMSGGAVSCLGFTKNANSKRIATFVCDFQGSNPVAPSGFTVYPAVKFLGYYTMAFAAMDPANYSDGLAMTWTGLSNGYNQSCASYEYT